MRRLLIALVLVLAFDARALITNNLVADWQGGVGVTAPGGRVAQWNDQHLLLNNDGLPANNLTQSNATYQPFDTTDAHGYRGILFPWSYFSPQSNDFLNLPTSLGGFDTDNMTVYVVATGSIAPQTETMVWLTGMSAGWIQLNQFSNYPPNLVVVTQGSTIYPPLNPAVFVGASDTNITTVRWNNVTQTNTPQSRFITTSSGMIGSDDGANFYSGIIYRILMYKSAHTAAQMDAQVAELSALYGVRTNYLRKVVCRGASTSEGVASTMLQSYPFQLWQRYPEIEWYNQGLLGVQIGTNGQSGSMITSDGLYVDTLYDGQLQQNWLFVLAGLNDINAGASGFATWQRLTNYVALRKAARPWKVAVSTLQSDVLEPTVNADYNACIRTNGGPWDAFVDPGVNSPFETRLNNPSNPTYFYTDGVHLTNLGYGIFADYFGQIVNVPYRSTGFMGP